MALWKYFYRLTNIFFSISPEEYERSFKEEIWGCYKYIGIPLDEIYKMPIQDRKYFIMKHNQEQEEYKLKHSPKNSNSITGDAINQYASITQQNIKNKTNLF